MAAEFSVIIIAPSRITVAAEIASWISRFQPKSNCHLFGDPELIDSGFKNLSHRNLIAILLAGSTWELDRMLALSAWYEDYPLILMIPDRRPETIAKAHRLRPRYLIEPQIDHAELRAVLNSFFSRYFHAKTGGRPLRQKPRIISVPFLKPYYFRMPHHFDAKPGD